VPVALTSSGANVVGEILGLLSIDMSVENRFIAIAVILSK
jgi:hypothetical protein